MSINLLEESAIECVEVSYKLVSKELLILQSYDSYSDYFRSCEECVFNMFTIV